MHFLLAFLSFFIPPQDWEIAPPKAPSPYVQVGFVGKGSTAFRPSLNIAFETVDTSLQGYVKSVKEINSEDPKSKWRDLGKFQMKAGEGRLTEISTASPYGEVKILQALFVKDKTAYILSASILKEDFPKIGNEILKSFKSFNLIPDLFAPISNGEQQSKVKELFSSLQDTLAEEAKQKKFTDLQQLVFQQTDLGSYWQFVALKEGYKKLYPPK